MAEILEEKVTDTEDEQLPGSSSSPNRGDLAFSEIHSFEDAQLPQSEEAKMMASDDVKGGCLDPVLVAELRKEEVRYIRRKRVYTKVPRSEARTRSSVSDG